MTGIIYRVRPTVAIHFVKSRHDSVSSAVIGGHYVGAKNIRRWGTVFPGGAKPILRLRASICVVPIVPKGSRDRNYSY